MRAAFFKRLWHRAECGMYFGSLALSLLISSCGNETTVIDNQVANIVFDIPFAHDFGFVEVGSNETQIFTLTNNGLVPATGITGNFNSSSFLYDGDFPGVGGDCGETLDVGESCQVAVTFQPTRTSFFVEVLRIHYNNGLETIVTTRPELNGTGFIP